MNRNSIFKAHRYRLILLTLILNLFIAACGGGAYVGPSDVYYYDMHYRNPWYGHRHHMPPPHYIGPPPVIMPPPRPGPPVAVPLPM